MKRLLLSALVAFSLFGGVAVADPTTVGQFHQLPPKERREVAIRFMTTHPVSPCGHEALTREEALNIATAIVKYVRPGRYADDGSYISASTPLGEGIKHILGNIGC